MTDKHLTEPEAREFVTLLEKVEADMDLAFSDASDRVFGERDEDDSFEEKWCAPPSTVYVEETRGKLRQFIEHAYLRDDHHEETPRMGRTPSIWMMTTPSKSLTRSKTTWRKSRVKSNFRIIEKRHFRS